MTKDIQNEASDIPLISGVTNLQVMFHSKVKDWKFPVTLEVTVPISTRGAHMSRLIPNEVEEGDFVETILDDLANRIHDSCGVWPDIEAKLIYPWKDQFVDVITRRVGGLEESVILQTYKLKGITACPCSKQEMGIGHMQRCNLTIQIESRELYYPVLEKMERCFSCGLREKLKRNEEAEVIDISQANPRFVEDVVREVIRLFGKELKEVEVESEESIHNHNAIAYWNRTFGGGAK